LVTNNDQLWKIDIFSNLAGEKPIDLLEKVWACEPNAQTIAFHIFGSIVKGSGGDIEHLEGDLDESKTTKKTGLEVIE